MTSERGLMVVMKMGHSQQLDCVRVESGLRVCSPVNS